MKRSRQLTHSHAGPIAGLGAGRRRALTRLPLASAISAVLAGVPAAHAQTTAGSSGGLEEVVVTAQKKTERMQDVPVAIVALGTEKLEELHVGNLDDYVKYLPSVAYSRGDGQGGNGQPGASHVYMRGVVSGANENHSGSQPSVGTYLDEQPVTTIDGTVDVHVYDIARVEVLEGPQGTLYGASSQAGTIRIITNKPDPSRFSSAYNLGLSTTKHGAVGYTAEGYVNLPLSPVAAIRLVAWDEHDSGYISNVAGTNAIGCIANGVRTFPGWAGTGYYPGHIPPNSMVPCPSAATTPIGAGAISNAAYVADHYNRNDTLGGRGALKLNIGDNWTVTPTVMGQYVTSEGFFGYDPAVGDLQLAHFGPENSQDSWAQGALTVEGKIADFDLVYAGAFMKRTTHSIADYSDYSLFYDRVFGSGAYYWLGNNGKPIMPQELVVTKGYFQKWSNELRLSTPQDRAVKGTVGVFIQRQLHNIYEQYVMPGYGFTNPYGGGNPAAIAADLSIPTLGDTVWLTNEQRVDRDQAAFAQVTWDMTSQLSGTLGYRYFKADNSLQGFYGYSTNYEQATNYGSGMMACGPGGPNGTVGVKDATNHWVVVNPQYETYGAAQSYPCQNLNKEVTENGHVPRVNLSYKITPDRMVYATYSKGFRPGGVNRNGNLPPYKADYLTNYELGWKTQWMNRRLRWNGALFWEDWKDFQFSFLGPNSLTIINNGGTARIKGIESELEWAAGHGIVLSLNTTFLDPRMTTTYCGFTDDNGKAVTSADCTFTQADGTLSSPQTPQAPAGSNLPIAPKFKGNAVARYNWEAGTWDANVQAAYIYQTQTAPALRTADVAVVGMVPAYGLFDLSGGMEKDGLSWQLVITNVTDERAQISRFVQSAQALQPYVIPATPRTIGIKFGQKF
jgi:iron complex outermembrane recepter protein